jgi:hypothetical protein
MEEMATPQIPFLEPALVHAREYVASGDFLPTLRARENPTFSTHIHAEYDQWANTQQNSPALLLAQLDT